MRECVCVSCVLYSSYVGCSQGTIEVFFANQKFYFSQNTCKNSPMQTVYFFFLLFFVQSIAVKLRYFKFVVANIFSFTKRSEVGLFYT